MRHALLLLGDVPVVLDHGDDERPGDEDSKDGLDRRITTSQIVQYPTTHPVLVLAIIGLLGGLVASLELIKLGTK